MFYNASFMDKINKMQAKIDVLAEKRKVTMSASPTKKKARPNSAYPEDHPLACEQFPNVPQTLEEFRDMMDWVYGPKPTKHKSPTKRLMQ